METIRTYIDQMFKDLPKTKDVVEMKLNILDHMEEKYKELLDQGKNDSEASRLVIGEFGDMDEILSELDIELEAQSENINYLEDKMVEEVLKWKIIFSIGIAAGVFFCLLGIAISPLIKSLFQNKDFGDLITWVCFFIPIALGVILFIIFGILDSKYTKILKQPVIDAMKRNELEHRNNKFKVLFAILIALGVFLCILAVSIFPLLEYVAFEEVAILVFFVLIAVAVAIFIIAGINYNKYDVFLKEKSKMNAKLEAIQVTIMMSVTAIYLILGFTLHLWHPSWIIFPIGGIVCGIIEALHGE